MTLPVIVRPEAEQDLFEGRDWYENQQTGLGNAFLAAVDELFDLIRQAPQRYAAGYKQVRRVRMHRFPYVVYYRLISHCIEVIAVLHGSRSTRRWQSRA